MKERILQFLHSENKTSSQLAEEIAVQPSSISHIISGRNKPSLDFVLKMLNTYGDLESDWLLFGRGEMYKNQIVDTLFNEDAFEKDKSNGSVKNSRVKATSPEDFINSKVTDNEKHSAINPESDQRVVKTVMILYSDNSFSEYSRS